MKGPAGIDIPNKRARIYGTGNNPLYWTPLPTMALAAANMLRNPLPILNRPIYISTVANLTQSALLSAVESVLGTKFTVEHVDVEKINTNARIALDRGELAKAMNGLTVSNQFYEADSGNDLSTLAENETVGVPNVITGPGGLTKEGLGTMLLQGGGAPRAATSLSGRASP